LRLKQHPVFQSYLLRFNKISIFNGQIKTGLAQMSEDHRKQLQYQLWNITNTLPTTDLRNTLTVNKISNYKNEKQGIS
jgi:hypothetical protein